MTRRRNQILSKQEISSVHRKIEIKSDYFFSEFGIVDISDLVQMALKYSEESRTLKMSPLDFFKSNTPLRIEVKDNSLFISYNNGITLIFSISHYDKIDPDAYARNEIIKKKMPRLSFLFVKQEESPETIQIRNSHRARLKGLNEDFD